MDGVVEWREDCVADTNSQANFIERGVRIPVNDRKLWREIWMWLCDVWICVVMTAGGGLTA